MAHQIAPGLDHADVVATFAEGCRHVVAEALLDPQRLRRLSPRPAVEPAGRFDGGLRPEPAVYQPRHQGRLGLGLTFAAHGPVHEAGPPADHIYGWDQGVGRALARGQGVGMAGIEREERAAVLQEHPGVTGHDGGAELVIGALDHRDRVAVRVGRHDRDRVAVT